MTVKLSDLQLSASARSTLLEIAASRDALPRGTSWSVAGLLAELENRLSHVFWPSYGDRRAQSRRAVDLRESVWALTAAALVAAGDLDADARATLAERCGALTLSARASGRGAKTLQQLHAGLTRHVAERRLVVKAGPSSAGFAAEREILAAEELIGAVEWLAIRRAGEVESET